MITNLDETAALDQARVGAKAAVLARARRSGMPVLPGFIVDATASVGHMEIGAAALPVRGSGGARLAMTSTPAPDPARIEAAGRDLAATLVARSSTALESGGEWAGAFTSYVGITPGELPKAVVGCWASAFSPDALGRQRAAGVVPGSVAMAVLVQPAISPVIGGVAEIDSGGSLVVEAVAGPPGPLLQGWERGVTARRQPRGAWVGPDALALVGVAALEEIGSVLEDGLTRFGVNRCEWGVADRLWVLQMGKVIRPDPLTPPLRRRTSVRLVPTVQTLMAAPGVLGAELVHPWALAGLPTPTAPGPVEGGDMLQHAAELSESLTSQVWGLPAEAATRRARGVLARLRGPDPTVEIDTIGRLNPPDQEGARRLVSIIEEVGRLLVDRGVLASPRWVWHLSLPELREALEGGQVKAPRRVGVGVWEPLVAAVVLDHGAVIRGVPAAAGIAAGVGHRVFDGGRMPPPRAVVTAPSAVPQLSQLIWDAAALVTDLGSPTAHVFESARSLGVPAVCGVDPGTDHDQIVAVDGYSGTVATIPLTSDR